MEREIELDGTIINDDSDCYVIAEIGHNHMGDVELAKEMFKSAKECGANAVKLQKRDNKFLYVKNLYDSPYTSENSYGDTYGKHREALEFGEREYLELKQYAKDIDITMFSTAFDFNSANFLSNINMPAYKIASGDITNIPLLKHIASFDKPMIVSTGGASIDDVKRVQNEISPINRKICFLQCTAAYPVFDYEDMNLNVITTYRENFPKSVIGMSDHESGIAMAIVAYVLGARIIEKHFTLNRAWKGTDHSFSLSPAGLKRLIRDLHRAKIAMGDGVKRALECEKKPIIKMSKKLVASRNLSKEHIVNIDDISIKSPGDGIPPYKINDIVGKMLLNDIEKDEQFDFKDLK